MNKIIINPHYCSKEEYQELKNYLTHKTWDWQEISSGKKDIQKGRISQHMKKAIEQINEKLKGKII